MEFCLCATSCSRGGLLIAWIAARVHTPQVGRGCMQVAAFARPEPQRGRGMSLALSRFASEEVQFPEC